MQVDFKTNLIVFLLISLNININSAIVAGNNVGNLFMIVSEDNDYVVEV